VDAETVVEKVRKLIALATSPYAEEARTAAFKAAALIREFQLDVVDPVQRPRPERTKQATPQPEWPRWVRLVSKYDGYCKTCRRRYLTGQSVRWKQGVGCIHEYCDAP
jgi:hypothetical protein